MAAGRRILVLGGTGAIGRTVLRELGARGAQLAATWYRNDGAAAELRATLGAERVLRLDLASVPAIDSVVAGAEAALGGLDALVCCAAVAAAPASGRGALAELDAIDEAAWDALVDVNLRGVFFACRAAARAFGRSGGGELVLLAALDGVKAVPGPVHHAASKAGVVGLVRSLSQALGSSGVRVNAVAPGPLGLGVSRELDPASLADYRKHCSLRRLGRPEEVAAAVSHLALDNTYLTGQSLVLDGAL